MKKRLTILLSALLALVFALALMACDGKTDPPDNDGDNDTPTVKYTVVFDANGGKFEKGDIDIGDGETIDDGAEISSDGSKMTITVSSDILDEPWRIPDRSQYAFCGWATDANGEQLWDFDGEQKLSGDITLYAVWAISFDFRLSDDGKSYIVRGIGGLSGDVEVPETHNRKPVTGIDAEAFKNSSILTGIVVPDSVTTIGNGAFKNARNLKSVAIGEGITELPADVFTDCNNLEKLYLPKSLTAVREHAFGKLFTSNRSLVEVHYAGTIDDWCGIDMDCSTDYQLNPLCNGVAELYINGSAVTNVTINAESINPYAFYMCQTIEKVTIGKNVKTIGAMAFYSNGITSLTFASGSALTTVGEKAFMRIKIKKLVLPDSLNVLGTSAFEDCTLLTDVDLGGTKTVSSKAFENCYLIENIDLGVVEYLGEGAFNGNSVMNEQGSLASVTLPDTVWYLGRSCFGSQPALKSITFESNASGATWNVWMQNLDEAPEVVMSTALATPTAAANKVQSGGVWIRIAGTLTYSGGTVTGVSNTNGIGMLAVPKSNDGTSVTKIAANAFKNFKGLRYLTIEANVTDIGNGFVDGCDNLTTVTVAVNNSTYASTGSMLFKKNGSILWVSSALKSTQFLTIPNGVKSIPSGMFTGMNIRFLTIPESVTEIASGAFSGCTIEQAEIPAFAAVHVVNDKLRMADIISGTDIPVGAFKNAVALESVYLPDELVSIGANAFENCTSLKKITIPDSVTTIGANAFKGCPSLTVEISEDSDAFFKQDGILYNKDKTVFIYIPKNLTGKITVPEGITSIGAGAFEDCVGITEIVIPDSVTSVDKTAFDGCNGIIQTENGVSYVGKWAIDCDGSVTSVTLRADTVGVAEKAFYGCGKLTSLNLGGVKHIGENAFVGCDKLESVTVSESSAYASADGILYNKAKTQFVLIPSALKGEVTIPDGITEIGFRAFYGRVGLTSVTIGNGVKSIGESAFEGCSSISSPTLGNGVENIGKSAFCNCRGIKSIALPASVASVTVNAFTGCGTLASISVADNNTVYSSQDGILYNKAKTEIVYVPVAVEGAVTIPNGVTAISGYEFDGRSKLTSVTLPDGMKTIGDGAFSRCGSLTRVTMPNGVTSIGEQAFYECENLVDIAIPRSVTSIGSEAFRGCSKLGSVDIPNDVAIILEYTFTDCEGLSSVTLGSGVKSIGVGAFQGCKALTSISLPSGLESIGRQAFDGCVGLTSISIPDSVTYIESAVFNGCNNLIQSDGGVKYADSWVVGCDSIATSVTLRAGTKGISEYAFKDCNSLTSVTLPDGLNTIGANAFRDCKELAEINIPDSVKRIGAKAFNGTKAFTSNVSGVQYIGNWAVDNFGVSNLGITSLRISSGTVGIADSTLSGCSKLRTVEIPSSVRYMGESAFYGCSSLTNITFDGSEEEWEAVIKYTGWDRNMGNYTVNCNN